MDMDGCEGIFRVSLDVYPYSCSELDAHMRDDKISLCAEVPTDSRQASLTESRVTIVTHPTKCMPSWTKLLPFVKYSTRWPVG
jgi:hypothetical protein